MDKRAEKLLAVWKDGKWHRKAPEGTRVGVIEACVHLKLLARKLIPVRGKNYLWAKFRITAKGKRALKGGRFPDKDELARAIHQTMCSSFFCPHRGRLSGI